MKANNVCAMPNCLKLISSVDDMKFKLAVAMKSRHVNVFMTSAGLSEGDKFTEYFNVLG